MKKYLLISIILIRFYYISAFAQVDTQPSNLNVQVTLSTRVLPKQVPLNRTAQLTVQMTWQGDLDLVKINEIDEPILTNFEVVGTASSHQISGTAEGRQSTKKILYTLKPKTLGMGYIESVTLRYTDQTTEKSHSLLTQRIGVEIVSPVSEPGEVKIPWLYILIGLILILGILISYLQIKKRALKQDEEPHVHIEETYLYELKNQCDLKDPDRQKTLSFVIKMIRRYLAEKYQISALEATTEDLIQLLTEHEVEEELVQKCEALLKKTDMIQFSGTEVTQSELDEAYTIVETTLEKQLAQTIESQKIEEEEKSKKRRRK